MYKGPKHIQCLMAVQEKRLRTLWTLPRMMLPRFRMFQGALNVLGFRTSSATLTPALQAPESANPRHVFHFFSHAHVIFAF